MAYADNGTVRLWWDEAGSGPPVLLIMGFSYPADMWHRVWPAFTDDYRVLRFDNRGVGRSDVPKEAFTVGDMAQDAVAVLDAAGVGRAHVYGASMGGGIAQELALSHPERVASLVLACTAAPDRSEDPAPQIPRIFRIIPPRLLIRFRATNGYGDDVPKEVIDEDKAILRSTRLTSRGLLGQARAVASYSSKHRVGQIAVPTLVLHGDQDTTVPIEMGRELASLIPGARLEVIPGAAHNYIGTAGGIANQIVQDFWQDLPAP